VRVSRRKKEEKRRGGAVKKQKRMWNFTTSRIKEI